MAEDGVQTKRDERLAFILLAVVLAPVFAVATGIEGRGVFRMARLLPSSPAC